jgi:hypothetical protein
VAERPQFIASHNAGGDDGQWHRQLSNTHIFRTIQLTNPLLGNEQDKSSANLDHWHLLLQLDSEATFSGQTAPTSGVTSEHFRYHVCACKTYRLHLCNAAAQAASYTDRSTASDAQRHCRGSNISLRRPDIAHPVLAVTMGSAHHWNGP